MTAPVPEILADLLRSRASTHRDFRILTFVDESAGKVETRTFGELVDNSARLAGWLAAQGMARGDRFAILLANHPELVEAMAAASLLGVVAVPIDPRTRGDKLAYVLQDSGCKGVLCADYNQAYVQESNPTGARPWLLCVGPEYDAALRSATPVTGSASRDDTPLQVLYTSGTTGDPKGIVKYNAELALVAQRMPALLGIRPDDVLYSGLSLTHGNAQVFTLAVALGAIVPAVFSRRFTKSRLWQTIRNHRCTVFTLLGGMTTAIYSEPERDDDADNPVRLVISAGMPAAIWSEFRRRFGVELFEVYGAAEGGLFWNDGSGPVGSFGNLGNTFLHVSRVVDESDRDCQPGQIGELIWRHTSGQPASVRYLNQPDASAAKTRDGWFRTGDMVHVDADGWLYFDHRAGGGIRRNGDFINPGFVEKVVAQHPAVDDVFVYGVPSENMVPGEKDVVAAVVVREGVTAPVGEIFAHCRAHLEANFVPTFLQVVKQIPKTASEKPQERVLRARFDKSPDQVHRAETTSRVPNSRA